MRALRVDCSEELHEDVRKAAVEEHRSINNWVRLAIIEKLARAKSKAGAA